MLKPVGNLLPIDMMECNLPYNRVWFRWGEKEIEVTREKNGTIIVRGNNGGRLSVEPMASNSIRIKVRRF